jgi:hypothetical protein
MSAATAILGYADGWITAWSATKVIESVHEKWLDLALLR